METVPFKPKRDSESSREQPHPRSVDSTHRYPIDQQDFTNEEVSEVIRVALHKNNRVNPNKVSHDEMVAIGREFGLTEADLADAFVSIAQSRDDEKRLHHMRLAFRVHLLCFLVVNTGLFLINWLADPSFWWFLFPLVSWGMLVALHGLVLRYAPDISSMFSQRTTFFSRGIRASRAPVSGDSRVTFTVEVFGGLGETKGLAELRGDYFVLEFETADAIFEAIRSGVREVEIPITEISSVRLDRWLVWTTLVVRGRRLRTFDKVPGHKGGEIRLTIDSQARPAAEQLARDLAVRLD